jgi:prepilin-type N-terminal cleavage/methylation domain-containing protein
MPSIPPACLKERHMKTRAREAGFTLVEIAIVLVIIGLLLGGILKGQELITSARVRNLADQASAVQAAYYGFVDRYHTIPGDMLQSQVCGAIGDANVPGCPNPAAPGGNGNAAIDANDWGEASAVWTHLAGAGFIQGRYNGAAANAGAYTNVNPPLAPTNPWGGFLLLGRTANYLDQAAAPPPRLHLVIGNNIPVNVMRELDVKIDDSAPRSGVFRAPGNAAAFQPVGQETPPANPGCVANDANGIPIWNINGSSVGCNGYYLF